MLGAPDDNPENLEMISRATFSAATALVSMALAALSKEFM